MCGNCNKKPKCLNPANYKFVIIESPYAGKTPEQYRRNMAYLHAAIQDCLARGEIPYASHGFFPGALDDTIPEQRKAGIQAGFRVAEAFHALGGYRVFYLDRGMSRGMVEGQTHGANIGMLAFDRYLGPTWEVANDSECEHSNIALESTACCDCAEQFVRAKLPLDAYEAAMSYLTKKA